MLHLKNSRAPGYSIIYALILGGICVVLVIATYEIELQKKKYMLDSQRAILESENIHFDVNSCNGGQLHEYNLYDKWW